MTKYRINTKTNQVVEDKGNLGSFFFTDDWREATETEINSYLLEQAKTNKINEVKIAFNTYLSTGFSYNDNNYNIEETSLLRLQIKINCCENMQNFNWVDNDGNEINYNDKNGLQTLLNTFSEAVETAKQTKFSLKNSINDCETIAEIEAITITF